MIRPEELRIGNFIMKEGEFFQTTAYTPLIVERDTEQFDPIPLTDAWLMKMGFEKLVELSDGYSRYRFDGIQLSISPVDRDFFIEYVHQIPMKYVHTFQNFYFSVRQKELKIAE